MAYRRLLVPMTGGDGDTFLAGRAMTIAAAYGGHVAALLAKPNAAELARQIDRSLSARIIRDLVDAAQSATTNEAASALATLKAVAKDHGIPARDALEPGAGWSFKVREGVASDVVAQEALLSDLILFAHPAESAGAMWTSLEAALLGSRKPLLVLPRNAGDVTGAKIGIGWDGSGAAAHAVSCALPLLARAQSIEILNVSTAPVDTVLMDRLRNYLKLHGMQATEHAINPGLEDTAVALIDVAQRAEVGLLVIGGYGHSRFREFVLGGVTRHLLANASLPIFMAH